MKRRNKYLLVLLLFSFLFRFCKVYEKFDQQELRFYRLVQLIITPEEERIFKALDHRGRKAFMKEFWLMRDPDYSTPENEFLEEYLKRVKTAARFFRESNRPGWLTDRGMVFVLLGPPDTREARPFTGRSDVQGYEIWIYDRFRIRLEFIDRDGSGHYILWNYPPELWHYIEIGKRTLFLSKISSAYKERILSAKIKSKKGRLIIEVPIKGLKFVKNGPLFEGKVKVSVSFFFKEGKPKVVEKVKKISFSPTEQTKAMKAKETFIFEVPADSTKSRILIRDLIGEKELIQFKYFPKKGGKK